MSDKKKDTVRYIYVKDHDGSAYNFPNQEAAAEWCRSNGLVPGTQGDTEERRVRIRLRQRTGLYDVVLKVRREQKQEATA